MKTIFLMREKFSNNSSGKLSKAGKNEKHESWREKNYFNLFPSGIHSLQQLFALW
jgi:hypothetical protein